MGCAASTVRIAPACDGAAAGAAYAVPIQSDGGVPEAAAGVSSLGYAAAAAGLAASAPVARSCSDAWAEPADSPHAQRSPSVHMEPSRDADLVVPAPFAALEKL